MLYRNPIHVCNKEVSERSKQSLEIMTKSWPGGYKTFIILNSVEHEILNAHKYKKYQEIQHFSGSDKPRMLFFLFISVKMPTIVGILTFMSRKNFMLS